MPIAPSARHRLQYVTVTNYFLALGNWNALFVWPMPPLPPRPAESMSDRHRTTDSTSAADSDSPAHNCELVGRRLSREGPPATRSPIAPKIPCAQRLVDAGVVGCTSGFMTRIRLSSAKVGRFSTTPVSRFGTSRGI